MGIPLYKRVLCVASDHAADHQVHEIVEQEAKPGWGMTRVQRLLYEACSCNKEFRMITGSPVCARRRQCLAKTWAVIALPGPLRPPQTRNRQ